MLISESWYWRQPFLQTCSKDDICYNSLFDSSHPNTNSDRGGISRNTQVSRTHFSCSFSTWEVSTWRLFRSTKISWSHWISACQRFPDGCHELIDLRLVSSFFLGAWTCSSVDDGNGWRINSSTWWVGWWGCSVVVVVVVVVVDVVSCVFCVSCIAFSVSSTRVEWNHSTPDSEKSLTFFPVPFLHTIWMFPDFEMETNSPPKSSIFNSEIIWFHPPLLATTF